MATSETGSTDSSSSTDWLDIASNYSSSSGELYKFSWVDFDVDIEFKPVLHQKKIHKQQYNIPKLRKGVEFVKQFKGHRYPIGKKK